MKQLAIALPFVILLAGCQQSSPSQTAADAETTATPPSIPDTASASDVAATSGITMRYSCEQDHRVDIVGGGIARVALADGRVVEIPRVADSAPPHYSGEALSFEVGSDGAMLGQDEVGGFACRESD